VAEVGERSGGVLLAMQVRAGLELVDEIGFANRELGEELGAIEQTHDVLEDIRPRGPELVEARARAIRRDVAVQAGHHAVGIGQREVVELFSVPRG
jgi:hypothetical protein